MSCPQKILRKHKIKKIILKVDNEIAILELDDKEKLKNTKEESHKTIMHIGNYIRKVKFNIDETENTSLMNESEKNTTKRKLTKKGNIRKNNPNTKKRGKQINSFLKLTDESLLIDHDEGINNSSNSKSKNLKKHQNQILENESFSSDSFFLDECDSYFSEYLT